MALPRWLKTVVAWVVNAAAPTWVSRFLWIVGLSAFALWLAGMIGH